MYNLVPNSFVLMYKELQGDIEGSIISPNPNGTNDFMVSQYCKKSVKNTRKYGQNISSSRSCGKTMEPTLVHFTVKFTREKSPGYPMLRPKG